MTTSAEIAPVISTLSRAKLEAANPVANIAMAAAYVQYNATYTPELTGVQPVSATLTAAEQVMGATDASAEDLKRREAAKRHLSQPTRNLAAAGQIAERYFYDLAYTDYLTGLPNRRAFDEKLASHVEPLGVLIIDLDGFKRINDAWGHQEGDKVLVETSHLVRHAIRKQDFLARLGGDEFGILLYPFEDDPHDPQERVEGAEAHIAEVAKAYRDAHPHYAAVGFGITAMGEVAEPGISPRELHQRADAAVLKAKDELYQGKERRQQ